MAQLAGPRLRERWDGWTREPFATYRPHATNAASAARRLVPCHRIAQRSNCRVAAGEKRYDRIREEPDVPQGHGGQTSSG
jgi:hypothetical protein